jgi:hypothetical protein
MNLNNQSHLSIYSKAFDHLGKIYFGTDIVAARLLKINLLNGLFPEMFLVE